MQLSRWWRASPHLLVLLTGMLLESALTLAEATVTTTALFDCQAGLPKWKRGWSQEKKDWCCIHQQLGCMPTTTTTTPAFWQVANGQQCTGREVEWAGCPPLPRCDDCVPSDCQFAEWADWYDAGGCLGLCVRHRAIARPNNECGRPCSGPEEDTMTCLKEECKPKDPVDCVFAPWDDWDQCDGGTHRRVRSIATPAQHGGQGCGGVQEEVRHCASGSTENDCKWDDWDQWSACTCTCGGGTKRRNRQIITAPVGDGQLCAVLNKAEVGPCNTQSCDQACIDGQWGEWATWSDCSSLCGPGFRLRQRAVVRQPNLCGTPASGFAQAFTVCTGQSKVGCDEHDCKLSTWNDWSSCSSTCMGIRERSRVIDQFHTGNGQPCSNAALKEIQPCHPGENGSTPEGCVVTKSDCILNVWSDWDICPVTCGGGNAGRTRMIRAPAHRGTPCSGALKETRACSTQVCDAACVDCLWGKWSEWGACSKCGDQRFRHRSIDRMPNQCGKTCDAKSAKESSDCVSNCVKTQYCVWKDWSTWSGCSSECGPATKMRQRSMGLTFVQPPNFIFTVDSNNREATCAGTQEDQEQCLPVVPCTGCKPVVCKFGTWSEWQQPTCVGLCERERVIVQVNNECGAPCTGPLVATKKCTEGCKQTQDAQDCIFSDWQNWGDCKNAQAYRKRQILTPSKNGGQPCVGPLREARDCGAVPIQRTDCAWAIWSDWSGCSCSCGGGQRERHRDIAQQPRNAGKLCEIHDKSEIRPCNTQECVNIECIDGLWGQWQDWEPCSRSCEGGITWRVRTRDTEANQCGKPAVGLSRDTALCNSGKSCGKDIDCVFSSWSEWSGCTRTCDGVKRRSRQIEVHGRGEGRWCLGPTRQTSPCNPSPDEAMPTGCLLAQKTDCDFGSWGKWSDCPVTCGGGQTRRERMITHEARHGGSGCVGDLSQTRLCAPDVCDAKLQPNRTDCRWGDWGEWGACSKCGGQRTRVRHITQEALFGGEPCIARASEEMDDCPRKCHEASFCTWGLWGKWGECTHTCGTGGKRNRIRRLQLTAVRDIPGRLFETDGQQATSILWFLPQGFRLEILFAFVCGYFGQVGLRVAANAWNRRDSAHAARAAVASPRGLGRLFGGTSMISDSLLGGFFASQFGGGGDVGRGGYQPVPQTIELAA